MEESSGCKMGAKTQTAILMDFSIRIAAAKLKLTAYTIQLPVQTVEQPASVCKGKHFNVVLRTFIYFLRNILLRFHLQTENLFHRKQKIFFTENVDFFRGVCYNKNNMLREQRSLFSITLMSL